MAAWNVLAATLLASAAALTPAEATPFHAIISTDGKKINLSGMVNSTVQRIKFIKQWKKNDSSWLGTVFYSFSHIRLRGFSPDSDVPLMFLFRYFCTANFKLWYISSVFFLPFTMLIRTSSMAIFVGNSRSEQCVKLMSGRFCTTVLNMWKEFELSHISFILIWKVFSPGIATELNSISSEVSFRCYFPLSLTSQLLAVINKIFVCDKKYRWFCCWSICNNSSNSYLTRVPLKSFQKRPNWIQRSNQLSSQK